METWTLWTIGHSTHSIEAFVSLLRSHGIEAVADVRRHAGSRKYPQFGQENLSASLDASGVGYEWFPELGGRRRPRSDSRNDVWRNASFRGYADHMESEAFRAEVARLAEMAQRQRTAVMCAEAVWWRCHRALIADYLKVRGIQVLHILGLHKAQEHPYTSAARIRNGVLSYADE